METALAPLIRTIPMPPSPGGVEIAAIVSSRLFRVVVVHLLFPVEILLVGQQD